MTTPDKPQTLNEYTNGRYPVGTGLELEVVKGDESWPNFLKDLGLAFRLKEHPQFEEQYLPILSVYVPGTDGGFTPHRHQRNAIYSYLGRLESSNKTRS